MILWLVGFMGSGKSTTGRLLAAKNGMTWLDTDQLIEKSSGTSIADIFKNQGEDSFRNMEAAVFEQIRDMKSVVVSTGGGFPCHHDLMRSMLVNGIVVYLRVPEEELIRRLVEDGEGRPLLDSSQRTLQETVRSMMEIREPIYKMSHLIVDTGSDTVDRICQFMEGK